MAVFGCPVRKSALKGFQRFINAKTGIVLVLLRRKDNAQMIAAPQAAERLLNVNELITPIDFIITELEKQ